MAAPTLWLLDRFDERLGALPVLGDLTHTEELGGEDTLEFSCEQVPAKGDRLLWRDPEDGRWREHAVVRTDEDAGGAARVYAESSLSELLGDFVEEAQLVGKTATEALGAVLMLTRWRLGEVDAGDARRSCLLYHMNALAALWRIEEVWAGELECEIAVGARRVEGRTLHLRGRVGAWRGARLTYGVNAAAIRRTVLEDEVFTALYGYGKGLPVLDEEGAHTGG